MRMIEVQAVEGEKKFVNPATITKLVLKKNKLIEITLVGGDFDIIAQGQKGYQDLLEAMKITHSPASQVSELEEEKE